MSEEHLIPVEQICVHHHVSESFVHALHDCGLVHIRRVATVEYLPTEEMRALEKLLRLHEDLQLDAETLDLVTGLLDRIEILQKKLTAAHARLRFYEEG